jgi:phage shock protein PspC (stress-responsive transcriptional regulator)
MALKYGIFPDMSLAYFLFVIAGAGLVSYIICAIIFTAKTKQAKEEKSLSKGVLLKRSV